MKKIMQRGAIGFVILMMLLTNMNVMTQSIYAQEKLQVSWDTQNEYQGNLKITVNDASVTKVSVFLGGTLIEEMEVSSLHDLAIGNNGIYTIIGYGQNGEEVFKENQTIDEFDDFIVKENGDKQLEILSRLPYSEYVEIAKGESKTKIILESAEFGFSAKYNLEGNGTYIVRVFDFNKQEIAKTSINIQSFASYTTENKLEIKTINDMKRIIEQPNQSFVLMNDLQFNEDILANVNFTGTLDGNGYTIKGVNKTLFNSLENATISNLSVQGGALAQSAVNTNINNCGFYLQNINTKENKALIQHGENVNITSSFVLANVEGKDVAGFILEGTGIIQDSYVSGYLKGEKVFGFGKDVEVKNSYLSASLVGSEKLLFTNGKKENVFYDAQINNVSEKEAQAYTTKEMTSESLQVNNFTLIEGLYPQLASIIGAKESAKEFSLLSVQALANEGNLGAYENNATVLNSNEFKWDSEKAIFNNNKIQLLDTKGEVFAYHDENDSILNRFALRSVKTISEPKAGVSTTQPTTQITYPTVYGNYYLVLPSSSAAPVKPNNHKEAIESGWKIVYWSGVERASELAWNTEYTVYTYNKSEVTSKTLTTAKQMVKGSISFVGNYELGSNMVISISDLPSDVIGTLVIESSATLDGTWTKEKEQKGFTLNDTIEYTPTTDLYYKYLRVRYVIDDTLSYCGEFSKETTHVLARALADDNVVLENKKPEVMGEFSISDKLTASINISGKERDVTFKWYHEGDTINEIASGSNYTLRESDIGKKVFVVAIAKENSDVKGIAKSTSTKEVKAIKHEVPANLPELVGTAEDTMFTIKMNVSEGLYQFKVVNESDPSIFMEYPIISRAGTNTVIMSNDIKIEANSTYKVYVRRIGEYGYENSEYSSQALLVNTNKKSVTGDVKITGKMIYGEELSAELSTQDENQTGEFVWFRVSSDATREKIESNTGLSTYTLQKEDIGKYIEVAYQGTLNYASEITSRSDRISKADSLIPTINLTTQGTPGDYSVDVTLPNESSKDYIIGYSKTQDGVPSEYKEDDVVKTFTSGSTQTLKGFTRDTKYYLFIRYNDSETEAKSGWILSSEAVSFTTQKTAFTGTIQFTYENTKDPMRGQKIEAKLQSNNSNKGTWQWTRVSSGGSEQTIFDYALSDDKNSTYYIIPTTEEVGATYKVKFNADSGFEGNASQDSKAVVDFELPKYNAPSTTNISLATLSDTSISATMVGVDGQYRFRYKKASQLNDAFVEVEKDVYADAEVLIENLDRNESYVVQAKQIKDGEGLASDWSSTTGEQKTSKTEIAGYVSLSGNMRNGVQITATYNSATYSPTGDDTGGIWSWYRGSDLISGQTTSSYTLTGDDVGKIIKARYTMPSNSSFTGKVEAETNSIGKAINTKPSYTSISGTKQDTTDSHMIVEVKGINYTAQSNMYYLIQKSTLDAPTIPNADTLNQWTKVTGTNIEIDKDRYNKEFESKLSYNLYLVNMETATLLTSEITTGSVKINDHVQNGTIVFSGRTHVNKEYTATLKDQNNIKGTWKWYYSKTDYNTTNPTSWQEVTEGFYPRTNSETSVLSVSDDMKGRYIKAEFVADDTVGYVGTIKSARSSASVTKTFTEKLSISGKGYEGETITVTLSGSDRDLTKTGSDNSNGSQTFFTRLIQFQNEAGVFQTNVSDLTSVTKNSFTVKVPTGFGNYDGTYIAGIVNSPDRSIYTYENGEKLPSQWFNSPMEERIQFCYGSKISTAADLYNFMQGTGNYTDRTKKYVITDNINMSAYGSLNSSADFNGILNGDYHTINGLKNVLIGIMRENSCVKNLIFYNSNVNRTGNASVIANSAYGPSTIERVLAVDSYVRGTEDVGFLVGKAWGDYAKKEITYLKECMTAGGESITTGNSKAVGGIFGWSSGSTDVQDIAAISTNVNITNNQFGYIGGMYGGTDNTVVVKNAYVTTKIENRYASRGPIFGGLTIRDTNSFSNVFYDKTIEPTASPPLMLKEKAEGRTTDNLTGNSLKSSFGSEGKWTYKAGFYPRLSWVVDRASKTSPAAVSIANLYAATRGAFTSLDGKTSYTDMYGGVVNGTIQAPIEFLGSDFKIVSKDTSIFNVSNSGVITPLKPGNTDIEVVYTDPTTRAEIRNKFNFTSTATTKAFTSISISSDAKVGTPIVATANPSTNVTYNWYKTKGDGTRVQVASNTASSYTPDYSDAGYQIQAEAVSSGYGTMASAWSKTIQIIAPTSAPSINNISDNGATLTGTGGAGNNYEYAYATSSTGEKVIITQKGNSIALKGLQRNKKYYIFSRMAGGDGYSESSWGPSTSFTTNKTKIVGNIDINSSFNNATNLSMRIDSTNEQTGVWKIERLSPSGDVESIIENSVSAYTHNYAISNADVGKKLKISFVGTGDFEDSQSFTSDIIKKAINSAPTPAIKKGVTDTSVEIQTPAGATYEVGYRKASETDITILPITVGSDSPYIIEGLQRNTAYNIYLRRIADAAYEASPWSVALSVNTIQSTVQGTISISGDFMTNELVGFEADDMNQQKGIWKLERITDGKKTTISPSSYTIDKTTRSLQYKIRPVDATGTLKATFTGTGDYKGFIEATSVMVKKAVLTTENLPSPEKVSVVSRGDQTLNVCATEGSAQYQYGYALSGSSDIKVFDAVGGAGKTISISGLNRNTEYDIYIREAAKVGYQESAFELMLPKELTNKTRLNGYVNYTVKDKNNLPIDPELGIAKIGFTYTASYTPGNYAPSGDDLGGTWQWYVNNVAVEGETNASFTIPVLYGEPVISARYIAKNDSDFKDYVSLVIGTLSKERHQTPTLPKVEALSEDNTIGSKIKITSNDADNTGVYWYVQDVKHESVPPLVSAQEADTNDVVEGKWFKSSTEVRVTLNPNVEYIVYAAKLEDMGNSASSVVSQRPVLSAKDDLVQIGAQIKEADETTSWKVLQNKEIRVICHDKATTGVWKYYVSNDVDSPTPSPDSWKIINTEVRQGLDEGRSDTYAYTNFQVPLKYIGYKLRVVYTGNDGYEGMISYVADDVLVGTLISGNAGVTAGNDVTVGEPIVVEYNTSIEDEKGGYWRWYRDDGSSDQPELILDDVGNPYGAIGANDSYTPKAIDVGKKIYAEFNAAELGIYTGSARTDVLASIQRATQNTPSAPVLAQVNGTSIQMVLPNNYATNLATTPDIILGYKEKGSTDEITWLSNNKNDSWIKDKLKANTVYEIYARFEKTSEFYESAISLASEVTTGNESFDSKNLKIEANEFSSGQILNAKFSGSGFDQGYFKVLRSDESIAVDKVDGIVTDQEVSMSYVLTSEDIGANLIVQYIAKDNATKYGGYIEKSTQKVSKPLNPTATTTPVLSTIKYKEDQLKVDISSDYEYVLTTTIDAISSTSGDWQKLIDSGTTTYLFEGLDVNQTYYLHTRLAETSEYKVGEEIISAGVKTWERGRFTITYQGVENATNSNPTQYDELSEEISLKEPTKRGYTFDGWTYDGVDTPTKDVVIATHSTGDKTFVANWTINKYKIEFDCNNGNVFDIQKNFNEKLEIPEEPTKEGNAFVGWYKDTTLLTPWNFETDVVEDNTSLYAKWEPKSYSATFQGNGGTNPLPITGKYGNTWPTLPTSQRDGYNFEGWYTSAIGGDKVTEDTTVPAKNIVYYAHWTPIEYRIEYELENGTLDISAPTKYTIEENVNLVQPTKDGYEFLGWTFEGQNVPIKSVNIALGSKGNKLFIANWKQIDYQITYHLDGGQNNTLNPSSYKITDATFTLHTPRKENYAFIGWTYPGEFTPQTSVTITQGSQGDREFSANWEEANAIVNFDTQGGNDIQSINVKKGVIFVAPENPIKTGYTFTGWYTTKSCDAADLWNFEVDTSTKDTMTLYAGWKANEYTIRFEDPSASNVTQNKSYEYGSELQSKVPTFTRKGYSFDGWLNEAQEKVSLVSKVKADATYKASWKIIDYNLSYELNGGINHKDNPSTYNVESREIVLKDPTKEDSVFTGWTPSGSVGANSTGDKTFTATWEAADYNVVFVSNGGSIVKTLGAKAGDKIKQPDIPTKVGYGFIGWYKDTALLTPWNFDNDVVENDMSLYAKWEKINYNVRFMDGTQEVESRSLQYEDEIGALPEISQEGYIFKGWYTLPSGGEAISETTKIVGNIDYYARWSAKEYSITYNLNGGTNHKNNPTSYSITTSTIVLKAPTKEGYIFTGWTPNGEISLGSTGNKEFEASWQKADFEVKFDTQGGSSVTSIYAIANTTITPPENPTKEGHAFRGWFKDVSYTVPWNFIDDSVSENTTLYAKWDVNTYKAEFIAIPGENVIAEIVETYGDTLKTLPTVSRNGYEFMGWYTQAEGGEKISESTKVVENTVYYGHWNRIKYAITYELNNGINAVSNPSEYTIETKDIVLSSPTLINKTFIGWTYEGQSTPTKDVTIAKGSMGAKHYVAHYKDAEVKVTFDSQSGSAVNPYYASIGDKVERPVSPTRDGYQIGGWYKESTCVNEWNFDTDIVSSDTTLYAKWIKNKYTIQFDTQGGGTLGNIQKEYEEEVGALPKPTKEGYEFDSWYDSLTGGNKIVETTPVIKNVTYYARWKAKNYDITYSLNGGVNHKDNPSTYTIESEVITLKQPSKENYAFTGWTYAGQSTPVKEVVISKGSIGKKTYTANWTNAAFTVTFDSTGGSDVDPFYAVANDLLQKPSDPTRKGYDFDGWYKDSSYANAWNFASDLILEDTTVYAKWVAKKYEICFDPQNGTQVSKVEKTIEDTLGELSTPSKKGYSFDGWYTQAQGGSAVSSTTKVEDNATYYAQWKIIYYQIAYNLAGGLQTNNPTMYTIESETFTITAPTRTGYNFIGWLRDDSLQPEKNVSIRKGSIGNITLTALWEKLETPNPGGEPEEKPTPPKPDNKPEIPEEPVITGPSGERNPSVIVDGSIKDGKISIPSDLKVNTSNGQTTVNVGKGSIVVNVSSNVQIKDMETLINAALTELQMNSVVEGMNIEIRLNVKDVEKVSQINKVKKLAKENGLTLANTYDVSITVREGSNKWMKIAQLNNTIEITLLVKKELQKIDADFYAIRLHEGKAKVLKDIDNSKKSVTVRTQQFSTYTIGYKESKENESVWILWIVLIGIAGGAILLISKKKKVHSLK